MAHSLQHKVETGSEIRDDNVRPSAVGAEALGPLLAFVKREHLRLKRLSEGAPPGTRQKLERYQHQRAPEAAPQLKKGLQLRKAA